MARAKLRPREDTEPRKDLRKSRRQRAVRRKRRGRTKERRVCVSQCEGERERGGVLQKGSDLDSKLQDGGEDRGQRIRSEPQLMCECGFVCRALSGAQAACVDHAQLQRGAACLRPHTP